MSAVTPIEVPEDTIDPTKLIVNFLPANVTGTELKEIFSPYGTVEEANVVFDRITKASRNYGFVKFSSEESAQRAIEALNGKVLPGQAPESKPLHVGVSKPSKIEVNLYVGNLLPTAKQEDLMSVFSSFGTIVECNIPIDRATNMGKGYGFVRLDSKSAAREAIDKLNNVAVESISGTRALSVKRADSNGNNGQHGGNGRNNGRFGGMDRRHFHQHPRSMGPSFVPPPPTSYEGVCVFVYNIPHQMTERGLQELFQTYGTVTCSRVMRNPNRSSKGFGFVNMSTMEEANKAIDSLNGKLLIPDRPLQVSLKKQ